MEFKFTFDDKEYILNEDNFEYFVNDEENPIKDIDEKKIIAILHNSDNVEFAKAFFDFPCENCNEGVTEKKKFFDLLGFNFYIYTVPRTLYLYSSLFSKNLLISFCKKLNCSAVMLILYTKHLLLGYIANTPSYRFSSTRPAGKTLLGIFRPKENI